MCPIPKPIMFDQVKRFDGYGFAGSGGNRSAVLPHAKCRPAIRPGAIGEGSGLQRHQAEIRPPYRFEMSCHAHI